MPKNDVGALSKMMLEVYRTDRRFLQDLARMAIGGSQNTTTS